MNLYMDQKIYEIHAYNSHTTVFPYAQGDNPVLEKMLSKWDAVTHRYIPIGYYIEDHVLYIPRGISLNLLARQFNAAPIKSTNSDPAKEYTHMYDMKFQPRDRIQEESVAFLTCEEPFQKGRYYTQYGLNLDTGKGKTYCMINALSKLNMRTIIITHKNTLKEQWINEFLSKTNIDPTRLISIDSSEEMEEIYALTNHKNGYIYFVNHQTINSYAKTHSWRHVREFFMKLRFGIKVVDEAHKFFENSLMIDFFSDTRRSYYLTATFTRSDPNEIRIFNKAYASLYRFGEETHDYEENRRHIILTECYYQGNATYFDNKSINGGAHGFNSYKYIDYALKNDQDQSMLRIIRQVMRQCSSIEGRILITSPKIESVEEIARYIQTFTEDKVVGTVTSHNSPEENEEVLRSADIISATIKGLGEGNDIKGLRVLINTTPIGSRAIADQLRGRLREYASDKDTFMFYLLDTSVPYTLTMYNRIRPVFRQKCKMIYTTQLSIWD